MAELKEVYTVKELAELLNSMPAAIRYNIRKGNIKATIINGGYVVSKEEVQRLLDKRGATV